MLNNRLNIKQQCDTLSHSLRKILTPHTSILPIHIPQSVQARTLYVLWAMCWHGSEKGLPKIARVHQLEPVECGTTAAAAAAGAAGRCCVAIFSVVWDRGARTETRSGSLAILGRDTNTPRSGNGMSTLSLHTRTRDSSCSCVCLCIGGIVSKLNCMTMHLRWKRTTYVCVHLTSCWIHCCGIIAIKWYWLWTVQRNAVSINVN